MSKKITKEEFIEKAINVHGDKYDYSKVEYINNHTKVCIICPTHGEFWQQPNNHLHGNGCPKCQKNNKISNYDRIKNIEEKCKFFNYLFLGFCDKDGKIITNYDNKTKLKLKCQKCNTEWNTTSYSCFVNRGYRCNYCNKSKLEKEINDLLKDNLGIEYDYNKFYKWLDNLQLDFYIPSLNIAIECQGKQHFNLGGWSEPFHVIEERDKRKRKLCEENGIKLLYYSNLGIEYPYQVYENKEELLKEILKYGK